MKKKIKPRCEGWRRTGIFQMGGTGRWEQCKADAIVKLKFKNNFGKIQILPACQECWHECKETGVRIIKVTSL